MRAPDPDERKVLVTCTFISACICFLPGEWVSGVALLGLAGLLMLHNRRATAREAAASRAGPTDTPAGAPSGAA